METAIEARDLTVAFRRGRETLTAVDRLNMRVETGQVVGFLGPNGAGKTTTMHVLLGFQAPTSGQAFIFGADVNLSIARRRIGYLPEHPDTYRFLTGRELLTFTGRMFKMEHRRLRARVDEVLSLTDIRAAADRRIATYSRGMMQRICLSQALINDPDLVILDEPTGGLDPIGRMDIRRVIADLRERGKTVFFSSHELSEVELVCDHVVILSHGRMAAEGKVSDLVRPGENLERYFLRTVGALRQGDSQPEVRHTP